MRLIVRRPAHPGTPPAVERLRQTVLAVRCCGVGILGAFWRPLFENARLEKVGARERSSFSANQEPELKMKLISPKRQICCRLRLLLLVFKEIKGENNPSCRERPSPRG